MQCRWLLVIYVFGFLTSVRSYYRNPGPQKWISELFLQASSTFTLDEHVSPRCRNDFKVYKSHLANQTVWAVRMLESSSWPTLSLLSGVTTHLGNWGECLQANGSGVSGQYCLVEAKLNCTFHKKKDYWIERIAINSKLNEASAWDAVQTFENNPVYRSRLKLTWALCVPSSCSTKDVATSLESILVPLFEQNGLSITVNIESNMCSIPEDFAYPAHFLTMISCIAMLCASVILISSYYIFVRGTPLFTLTPCETNGGILQCFSLDYSVDRLQRTKFLAQYNLIYIFKLVGIVMVIGAHIILTETRAAIFQPDNFERLFYFFQCYGALESCVDIFSLISGFIMYFYLDQARRGGFFFVFYKVLSQWAKLSAMICMHTLLMINVWPHLGDGPLWKKVIFSEADKCRRNWWLNVLAINNFYPPHTVCMVYAWYLSVYVQLSVLGGVLLYAYTKSDKIGHATATTLFITGVLRTFFLVYSEAYNSIFVGYMKTLSNMANNKDFLLYISTSTRMGPYILGFIAAYITRKMEEKKMVFSKIEAAIIFSTTLTVAILFGYYRNYFAIEGRPYYFFENAVYASFSRTFLTLPFACLLCVYYTSMYSTTYILNILCQHKIWVLLGRLVPNVYFFHTPLLLSVIMSRRTYSPTNNQFDIVWQSTVAVVHIFAIALFWFLFIESPLSNITLLILARITKLYQSFKHKRYVNANAKKLASKNGKKIG